MLWDLGQWSRFVRPGAVRVGISGSTSNMRIATFRNVDWSLVVVFINSGNAVRANIKIETAGGGGDG